MTESPVLAPVAALSGLQAVYRTWPFPTPPTRAFLVGVATGLDTAIMRAESRDQALAENRELVRKLNEMRDEVQREVDHIDALEQNELLDAEERELAALEEAERPIEAGDVVIVSAYARTSDGHMDDDFYGRATSGVVLEVNEDGDALIELHRPLTAVDVAWAHVRYLHRTGTNRG